MVVSRGLELRAKHAVISNESPVRAETKFEIVKLVNLEGLEPVSRSTSDTSRWARGETEFSVAETKAKKGRNAITRDEFGAMRRA